MSTKPKPKLKPKRKNQAQRLKLAGSKAKKATPKWTLEKVWTKNLSKPFTALSTYFVDNYHRLKFEITPTEFCVIVHLIRYKWDEDMPRPAIKSISDKMMRSEQAVRTAIKSLEVKGYLKRHMRRGRPSHYDLQPLFDALEVLYLKDVTKKAAKESEKRSRQAG